METFSTRQTAVIAAANKTVSWLFRVTDNLDTTYYWSTGTQASSGSETVLSGMLLAPGAYTGSEWERAHTFKIVNFSGITLRRGKSESGIHAPNDVSFSIVNSGNALDAANFSGGTVRIGLVIDDGNGKELCGSWRFRIKSASPYAQQIDVTCEDFLQEFLTGSYPNTRLISDIFPVADGVAPDTMCIPEPYGTCYIPLRSVYAGAARYYILGDPANTFTIDEVRSPRALGAKITWTSAGFTFQQSTVSGWRMFQALIADGGPGIFMSGDRILDVPTKFSRSDTAAVTGPAEIIRRVLRNMGLLDYDLDLASFDTAAATFAGWGLAWNFAFYYREDRKTVLSRLLAMCHCALIIGETVRLQVLSKTSQATITNASVLKIDDVGQDTFRYMDAIAERVSDSGYVAFQQTGEAQDAFIKIIVPAKSATDVRDAEVITFPGVQDNQHVQKLGTLHYQRKFLKAADISFTGKGTHLALRPDDVITVNYADYGGTYNVLIDELTISPDVSVSISAIRFSETLDDWEDLAPGAITIASDTPTTAYSPVIAGPDGTAPTSGNMPNSLPGRLRVGQSTNFILLEPVSPLRMSMYSADTERLRIGNLNGFLGYVTDTYGIAIGSAAKYLKYDPTNGLRLGGSGVARIELDLELARISVKDATDATKTAMGYLNGLAKNDGTGNWGPGDYGFWAAAGDNLKIDGDAVYKSGDWIVENDGAYLIQNAAGQTIIRLGTVSGVKGLYVYDAETVQGLLAKFATDGLYLGTPGETTDYLKYTPAGGLVIRGGLNADDITAGTMSVGRLTIADLSNIVLNPTFTDGSSDQWTLNGNAFILAKGAGGVPANAPADYVCELWEGTGNYALSDAVIDVIPGEEYYGAIMCASNVSAARAINLYLRVELQDGTFSVLTMATRSPNNAWGLIEGIQTIPANGKKAQLYVGLASGAAAYYWYFTQARLRRAVGAELVVDGSIVTSKLYNGSFTPPGNDSVTPGSGMYLDVDAGTIQAYGGDQTFGGTVIASDGTFFVSIGKYLTATGKTKRYPLNNATNFTAGGLVHAYYWSGSAWQSNIGALVYMAGGNQQLTQSQVTAIAFDGEAYDTCSIHDNSTNNTRLTVPSNVTRVKLSARAIFANNATGERAVWIYKNGGISFSGAPSAIVASSGSGSTTEVSVSSPILEVAAGDYFELYCAQYSGGNLNVIGYQNYTWFAMEIVE